MWKMTENYLFVFCTSEVDSQMSIPIRITDIRNLVQQRHAAYKLLGPAAAKSRINSRNFGSAGS